MSRVGDFLRGVGRTWSRLSPEQRVAGVAATLLIVSTFGPFSFVELAIVLVGLAILVLLRMRAEGREFHLPFGDGTVIAVAGRVVRGPDPRPRPGPPARPEPARARLRPAAVPGGRPRTSEATARRPTDRGRCGEHHRADAPADRTASPPTMRRRRSPTRRPGRSRTTRPRCRRRVSEAVPSASGRPRRLPPRPRPDAAVPGRRTRRSAVSAAPRASARGCAPTTRPPARR